jgi:hypothetical protein
MEAVQCLICLEPFEENEALIPELECSCLLIVHEACWEPWSGECLYCRQIEEYIPPVQINQSVYVINICPTVIVVIGLLCSFFLSR